MSNPEIQVMKDLRAEPRLLKNKLPIYPVKLKDALEFYDSVSILNIPKNTTNDVEVLQMSYLKFLIVLSSQKELSYLLDKLYTLLQLVLHTDDIKVDIKENGKFYILINNEFEITEYTFDKLKTMIAEQNMVDLDDDNINPELKKKLKEAEEFMAKRGGQQVAPFSQQILAYQYEMKLPLDEVFNMTIFQFKSSLEVISHIKYADILQQAKYSGFKEFKDDSKLPTWLSAIEKSKTNPLLMDADQLKNNMGSTFSA